MKFNTRFEKMQSISLDYKSLEEPGEEIEDLGDEQTKHSLLFTQKFSDDPAKQSRKRHRD
jgi:hypothetical protein